MENPFLMRPTFLLRFSRFKEVKCYKTCSESIRKIMDEKVVRTLLFLYHLIDLMIHYLILKLQLNHSIILIVTNLHKILIFFIQFEAQNSC
jgi:hypothetical protein